MQMLVHEGVHVLPLLYTEQCLSPLKHKLYQGLVTRIFRLVLHHGKAEPAVMTTPVSFPSEPTGGKIHQPESQICFMDVAAGISVVLCLFSQDEWRWRCCSTCLCVVFALSVYDVFILLILLSLILYSRVSSYLVS